MRHPTRTPHALSLALMILPLASVSLGADLQVFATFEDPAELRAVQPSAGLRVSASKRFPAWGADSLEVVYPPGGGTVVLSGIPEDWRRQESLLFFAWSQEPGPLTVILGDAAQRRFAKSFNLRAGVNHIQLPLRQVTGVDLRRMLTLGLESRRAGTLYLDYFALDRFHPVLEKRGRWDIDYSTEVVTPHVAWARPFAAGPIRAYALADVADGRGIVELAQRLELSFKATTIGRSPGINKWGFGDFYRQRSGGGEFWSDPYSLAHAYIADDLLHGPEYDVILWPGLHPWETYPAEVREEIRKRVENGAGLVLFEPGSGPAGEQELSSLSPLVPAGDQAARKTEPDRTKWRSQSGHYITRGVPFEAFPWGHVSVVRSNASGEVLVETERGAPVLAVRNYGRGRVVAFAYAQKGMIPAIENVFETGLGHSYHEYLWSLVARAVVWAAKREAAAAIVGLERSAEGVRVALRNPPAGAVLEASIQDSFGEHEMQLSAAVPRGAVNQDLKLTRPLTGGRHFLDLRLLTRERVHDWAAVSFEVPSPVSIQSVTLDAGRVEAGRRVTGRLRLSAGESGPCTVTARLFDNYERLVDERRMESTLQGGAEIALDLDSAGVLTHLARVDCEVAVRGLRSDRRIAEVFVLQPRRWDDYDIVMYRFGPDPIPGIWPTIDRLLRRLHVTTLSSYSLSHSKHANYNIQAQTRISGQESPDGPRRNYYIGMKKKYAETRDKRGLVREHCLNDPAYRRLIRDEIERLTEPWVPFSPLSYYVYEEPSLTCYEDDLALCFSTHCMASMREWLKGEYGTLDALNRQWGTGFESWNEVVPDDTYEAQARGNYSSWADHRTFMESSYASSFAYVLGLLRKIDPQGILLNSGTQESGAHNGCDYSRINPYTQHLNAYSGGNQLDFHRNFNPEIKISGGAGYGVLGRDVFYDFYGNLFKGSNGGAYVFWQYSTLDPDLTMSQSGKDMEQGFRELRGEGIGKLVGLGAPDNHGIALHYSYPSIHGTWIVDGQIQERVVSRPSSPTLVRFNANRDGWVKALRDAGLQFDFLAYGDVEKGGLLSKGYSVFILPMSVALSEREVEAIRTFVRRGGTVIADALPGIMDQHCAFRVPRALGDVFGIEPRRVGRDAILEMKGEPGLALKGARVLLPQQDRPLLLESRFGAGRAFLLNFFLDRYPEEKLEGRHVPILEKVKQVLTAAGIRPKVRLTSLAGAPVTGCETYLFNNGTTRLFGLLPDKELPAAEQVRIHFDGKGALYDVRQKRYIGTGSSFETAIEPGVPRLLALIDSPVRGLEIQAPAQARRGEPVSVRFLVPGAGKLRSVAKVVVTDPAQRPVAPYGGNADVVDGRGSVRFSTALNDPVGQWRVSITEVLSGVTRSATVTLR